MSGQDELFDAVVVGGGPAGATAASELAWAGRSVLLLDKAGRIKPCGGAIPPRLIRDFEIPRHLICAQIRAARMVSPSHREVDMPIDGGYVGMVDREIFDEFLRARAARSGAVRRTGVFERISRDDGLGAKVHYQTASGPAAVRARLVIGADGALSQVARQEINPKGPAYVFAYHEIVRVPTAEQNRSFDGSRCDVVYDGVISPDFYGWVFPHGATASIGSGSAKKGFSLRGSVATLRAQSGLAGAETLRREGAPIPMKPLASLGQWPGCTTRGRCRGRRRPGLGRRHLLRDDRGPAGRGGRRRLSAKPGRARPAPRPQALHEGSRPGILDPRDHAALLVQERSPARALRQHLPRPGRAGPHLAGVHEQRARARAAGGPRADLSSRIWRTCLGSARHESDSLAPGRA